MNFSGGIYLFFIILLFSACENDPRDIAELVARYEVNVEVAKDVEILYSDSARVKVKIEGPRMLNYLDRNDPHQEFTEGIVVTFYGPQEEVSSLLTAQRAQRYENKGEMIVQDSVVWISMNNEKLGTEELIWDERKQIIYSKKFVVITRPDEIIYGHGFEASQDFSYSKINAIEGRLKVDNLNEELQ